ncbi:hypothetical protein AVEN_119531-1 [Araneus ventricosus]|uniref:Uncharacterized protein n=1 Tax=Araneus ventricosus TaxID=182803 RepID=A0A4Y2JBF5_ARAVE|nr:hypothetical protein AVEN_119531-1 [Araneus ventricosus]
MRKQVKFKLNYGIKCPTLLDNDAIPETSPGEHAGVPPPDGRDGGRDPRRRALLCLRLPPAQLPVDGGRDGALPLPSPLLQQLRLQGHGRELLLHRPQSARTRQGRPPAQG